MIDDYTDRHLPFEACFNFRDIGGYKTTDASTVRWGKYYRAGRQDRMTSTDIDRAKEHEIATQIDLRRPDEIREQGRGPFEALGARYENLAVIPDGGSEKLNQLVGDVGISGARYLGYLELGPDVWIRLFNILADEASYPILLHCTAGKDRTGVSTAFLLSVLGVDRPTIDADYLLTNRDVERQVDYVQNNVGLPKGFTRSAMITAAGVPQTAITDFLDGVDKRYGGPIEYLRGIGITDKTFDRIRGILLTQ